MEESIREKGLILYLLVPSAIFANSLDPGIRPVKQKCQRKNVLFSLGFCDKYEHLMDWLIYC